MQSRLKWFAAAIATLILVTCLAAFSLENQTQAKSTISIACVGDSITAEYPADLWTMHRENYKVGNFGVGGTTVSLQFRKPYINQTAMQNAQAFSPDIVVIMLGTNDAFLSSEQRSNFIGDYKTLIAQFQAFSSKPKIFIAVPPPVFNNTIGLNGTTLVNDVMPLVKQTANDLGLPLIDVHTPLVNHPEDFSDGVHPNSQGSRIIAETIFNIIS